MVFPSPISSAKLRRTPGEARGQPGVSSVDGDAGCAPGGQRRQRILGLRAGNEHTNALRPSAADANRVRCGRHRVDGADVEGRQAQPSHPITSPQGARFLRAAAGARCVRRRDCAPRRRPRTWLVAASQRFQRLAHTHRVRSTLRRAVRSNQSAPPRSMERSTRAASTTQSRARRRTHPTRGLPAPPARQRARNEAPSTGHASGLGGCGHSSPPHALPTDQRAQRGQPPPRPRAWATGARERDVPSWYSAHQRTMTPSSSRRTIPTRVACVAARDRSSVGRADHKRLRRAGSQVPRNSATSEEESAGPDRGKASSVDTPSRRATSGLRRGPAGPWRRRAGRVNNPVPVAGHDRDRESRLLGYDVDVRVPRRV